MQVFSVVTQLIGREVSLFVELYNGLKMIDMENKANGLVSFAN